MFDTLERPKSKTLKKITCACTVYVNHQESQKEYVIYLHDGSRDEIREELKRVSGNTVTFYKVLQSTIAKDGEINKK